jgi:hypothetical protein
MHFTTPCTPQANQFPLNADKTNTVQITPTKVSFCPLILTYVDHLLIKTDTIKFFGLQLASHITWRTYINCLLSECCVF